MVTAAQYEAAVKLCAGIEDVKLDDFFDPEGQEDAEDVPDTLDDIGVVDGVTEDAQERGQAPATLDPPKTKVPRKRRRALDIHIARFISTKQCHTKVLDSVFHNPPHISCYEAGACSLCAERQARGGLASGKLEALGRSREIKRE